MQIIPKSSFTRVPWKNGGGITHEAFRVPSGAEAFRWRVSVAEIAAAGPFSPFPEYHRTLLLLAGSGVRLSFAGGRESYLRETGDWVEFDGAFAPECELLGGPCTDLNLIVSKSMVVAAARVENLREARSLVSEGGRTTLIFAVRGSFSLRGPGLTGELQPWDLAILGPGEAITLSPESAEFTHAPLVFFATLDDNR